MELYCPTTANSKQYILASELMMPSTLTFNHRGLKSSNNDTNPKLGLYKGYVSEYLQYIRLHYIILSLISTIISSCIGKLRKSFACSDLCSAERLANSDGDS